LTVNHVNSKTFNSLKWKSKIALPFLFCYNITMTKKNFKQIVLNNTALILGSLALAFVGLMLLSFIASLFAFETVNPILIFAVFVALLIMPSMYYYYGSFKAILWELRVWIVFFAIMLITTLFKKVLGFYEMLFWMLVLLGALGLYINMHPQLDKKLKGKSR